MALVWCVRLTHQATPKLCLKMGKRMSGRRGGLRLSGLLS